MIRKTCTTRQEQVLPLKRPPSCTTRKPRGTSLFRMSQLVMRCKNFGCHAIDHAHRHGKTARVILKKAKMKVKAIRQKATVTND